MATTGDITMPLPLDFRGDVAMRKSHTTDLVTPLPSYDLDSDPIAEAEAAEAEMGWSYNDAQLTQQLRASHAGRGLIVAAIATSVLAVAVGIALVL